MKKYYYVNQLGCPHIPYFTSIDTEPDPEKNIHTVATDGCGLCSAVMIAHLFDEKSDFSLYDAAALSNECGANHNAGTDYPTFAPAFAEKMGYKLEISDDTEKLRACLKNGGGAVVHCKNTDPFYTCLFTQGGHYIAVVGLDEKGRAIVLDPSYKYGKYDTPEGREKIEVKDRYIALCDLSVLADESRPKKPNCFYLFFPNK